jgi:hypothetical protein
MRFDFSFLSHYILVGKPVVKGSLGRPRQRWEDNIELNANPLISSGICMCYLI